MELIGNGLAKGSHMYFYTPSQNAKKLLYYPIAIGNFYCKSDYIVERERYDSILLIYVLQGSMTLEQNAVYTAGENEILLVDCYKPHKYFTNDHAHTLWVHFDAGNSRQWLNLFASRKIKCGHNISDCILKIIDDVKSGNSEYEISSKLYSLLCKISDMQSGSQNEKFGLTAAAKEYIQSNFNKTITVEDIAKSVNLSASYFSRLFKNTTNLSPYDYLLSVRLEKAKELLHKTDYPISQIAYQTGFNSDANFIYFFKKHTGTSPLKFRKIKF